MLHRLTLNSILLILIAMFLIAYGAWSFYKIRDYTWTTGLVCLGIGNGLFGITNGFSDLSPRGRVFMKIGVVAFVFGILIVGSVILPQI